jgi:hypothetical protein
MLTALVHFLIAAVIITVIAYVLILLWDWVCSMLSPPGPIGQLVRVIIVVIAVIAILYQLVPLVSRV